MTPGQGLLTEALAAFIRKKTGQEVPPDAWKEADLPPHLRMNFSVVDEAGMELASGRDLAALKEQLGQAAQLTFASAPELDIEKRRPDQLGFRRPAGKDRLHP